MLIVNSLLQREDPSPAKEGSPLPVSVAATAGEGSPGGGYTSSPGAAKECSMGPGDDEGAFSLQLLVGGGQAERHLLK